MQLTDDVTGVAERTLVVDDVIVERVRIVEIQPCPGHVCAQRQPVDPCLPVAVQLLRGQGSRVRLEGDFAIGGNFGGDIDPDLELPQEYAVDYVRVYQLGG